VAFGTALKLSANVTQSILCCLPSPVSTTHQVQQVTESVHPRTFVHEVSLILEKEKQTLPPAVIWAKLQGCVWRFRHEPAKSRTRISKRDNTFTPAEQEKNLMIKSKSVHFLPI
jgi:hypothetical protein